MGRPSRSPMKVKLLLCEASSMHGDGTVSMLRSGLTHVWTESVPTGLAGCLVAFISTDIGDDGNHRFDLRCLDTDGNQQMPSLKGNFVTAAGGHDGISAVALDMRISLPRFGRYLFVFRVDGRIEDEWPVLVLPPRNNLPAAPDDAPNNPTSEESP